MDRKCFIILVYFVINSLSKLILCADLLYLDRYNLRSYDLESHQSEILLPTEFINAIALDFHHGNQKLYISDVIVKTISCIDLSADPPTKEVILTGLDVPDGLAIDWVHNNLYWTDTGTDQINVFDLDTEARATVIEDDLDEPRAIVLDLRDNQRWMYFSDWGFQFNGIFRAGMDGSNRMTLADTDLFWPNGLSIDYGGNKIYWVDGRLMKLESSNLDGSSRTTLFTQLGHPFSLVIFDEQIYWTEWETLSVKKGSANGQGLVETVTSQASEKPSGIQIFDASRQPDGSSVCGNNNQGCSHVCVPSHQSSSYACACPSHMLTGLDGKTCELKPTMASTPDGQGDYIALLWAENSMLGDVTRIVRIEGNPYDWAKSGEISTRYNQINDPLKRFTAKFAAVDVRYYSNEAFFTDNGLKSIYRYVIDEEQADQVIFRHVSNSSTEAYTEQEKILPENNGIAVDWLSDAVYYTDKGNGKIIICNSYLRFACKILVSGLSEPFGIAVHPHIGQMFWTESGAQKKIVKAKLDGTVIETILTPVGQPAGITIDYERNVLFYIDQTGQYLYQVTFDGSPAGEPYKLGDEGLSAMAWDVTIYHDLAFVTVQTPPRILVIHLVNRRILTLTLQNIPSGIAMYYEARQQTGTSPCSSLNCQDICVTNGPSSASCMCRDGTVLQSDGRTCLATHEGACETLNCGHICIATGSSSAVCMCRVGSELQPDGRTCLEVDTTTTSTTTESISQTPTENTFPDVMIQTPPDTNESPMSTPTPPSDESSTSSDDEVSIYLMVGIAAAALVFSLLLGVLFGIYCRREKPQPRDAESVHTTGGEKPPNKDIDTGRPVESGIYTDIEYDDAADVKPVEGVYHEIPADGIVKPEDMRTASDYTGDDGKEQVYENTLNDNYEKAKRSTAVDGGYIGRQDIPGNEKYARLQNEKSEGYTTTEKPIYSTQDTDDKEENDKYSRLQLENSKDNTHVQEAIQDTEKLDDEFTTVHRYGDVIGARNSLHADVSRTSELF